MTPRAALPWATATGRELQPTRGVAVGARA